MKSILKFAISILLLFNALIAYSQLENDISTRDRIYFGGTFGLMLGTYTQIEISPYVGWRFNAEWSVGGGAIYQYYSSSESNNKFRTSIYGSNFFSKYTIIRDFPANKMSLFAYAGYEVLSLENQYFKSAYETGRFLLHSFLVGGGLRQYLGGRASFEMLVLYNVNPSQYSPYNNPTIRVGFNF